MGREKKITVMVLMNSQLHLKWEVRISTLTRVLKWLLAGTVLVWRYMASYWTDGC